MNRTARLCFISELGSIHFFPVFRIITFRIISVTLQLTLNLPESPFVLNAFQSVENVLHWIDWVSMWRPGDHADGRLPVWVMPEVILPPPQSIDAIRGLSPPSLLGALSIFQPVGQILIEIMVHRC